MDLACLCSVRSRGLLEINKKLNQQSKGVQFVILYILSFCVFITHFDSVWRQHVGIAVGNICRNKLSVKVLVAL